MKQDLIYKKFSNMPTLETERLILRKMQKSDSEDMFAYARLPEVTRYLLWKEHENEFYTREYLSFIEKHDKIGKFYDWAIVDRESGRMIGTCGFAHLNFPNNSGEIGYVLNPEFWGRGIAHEACSAVIKFGFCELSLNRIEAKAFEQNKRSRRVMEKLGMTFEGVARSSMLIKGEYRDIATYAILKSEYDAE